jgi:YVTN family beta-propeller protein
LDDCQITGTYVLPGSWAVASAAINVQGDRLIIADDNGARIGLFKLPELTQLAAIPVGGVPMDMQLNTPGTHIFLVTQNSNFWIYAIAAQRFDTLETGALPRRLALRPPEFLQAWVACGGSSSVSVFNLAVFQLADTIPFPTPPTAVVFSPNGTLAYVARRGSPGWVDILDAASRTVITSIEAGSGPFDFAVDGDGEILAATDSARSNVRVWDLAHAQQWDVAIPSSPGRIRYSAGEDAFYVCSRQQGRVYKLQVTLGAAQLTDSLWTVPWVRDVALWESTQ